MKMSRRGLLRSAAAAGAAAALASPFLAWAQDQAATATSQPGKGKKILIFTKSQGFPHDAVTRKKNADGTPVDDLAWGEKYLKDWTTAAGYDATFSKEGSIFTPENIAKFDAFIFYTTGDLTKPGGRDADKTSVMPEESKAAFLKAIEDGKGFIGLHSAADTWEAAAHRAGGYPIKILPKADKTDPYCMMLGAEFSRHGAQQAATIRVASKTFPGLEEIKEFTKTEEWYACTNFVPDLHVILVQDTTSMPAGRSGQRDEMYRGDPYPETWARMHGKGRAFYTSMGHRQDIWNPQTHPLYKNLLLAAIAWGTGVTKFDAKPNLEEACPKLWAART